MSVVWLNGPVGAGKSTLAHALRALVHPVAAVALLDEDEVREAVDEAAASRAPDGAAPVARLSGIARVLAQQGLVVVVASSGVGSAALVWNRENLPGSREVYLHASPDTIRHRARRRRSIDGIAPSLSSRPASDLASRLANEVGAVDPTHATDPLRPPDSDLTLDMDNPEPPELLAFRVAVLIPEFVVAAAGAASLGAHRFRRGA